jgi:predicted ATP-grasp superfamily ATP-dependent carboligase
MSLPVITARMADNLAYVRNLMLKHGISRVVIVDESLKPISIITKGDMIRTMISREWRDRPLESIRVSGVKGPAELKLATPRMTVERIAKTLISRYEEGLKVIERALAAFGKVVVKPADGDGCAGLSLVSRPEEASTALSIAKQSTRLPYFLVQEYVEGENLSVCLLASDDAVVPLSINVQRVHLKGPREPSMYTGSVVPYQDSEQDSEEVLRAALRAVKSLGHVKGFFGVDLVLKGGEPYIVEVNPRFTTSYLALREVCEDNVPDLLVRSYFDKSSLRPVKLRGKAIVGKLIADRDMALNSRDLKPPSNAKVLSLITDKRYFVKKGEAYALYVVKEL